MAFISPDPLLDVNVYCGGVILWWVLLEGIGDRLREVRCGAFC